MSLGIWRLLQKSRQGLWGFALSRTWKQQVVWCRRSLSRCCELWENASSNQTTALGIWQLLQKSCHVFVRLCFDSGMTTAKWVVVWRRHFMNPSKDITAVDCGKTPAAGEQRRYGFASSWAWWQPNDQTICCIICMYLIHILTAKHKTSGTRQHCFGCGSCSLTRIRWLKLQQKNTQPLCVWIKCLVPWVLKYLLFSFFVSADLGVCGCSVSGTKHSHFWIGCIRVQHLRSAGSWGFVTFHSTMHVTVPRVPPRLQMLIRLNHFNQSVRG